MNERSGAEADHPAYPSASDPARAVAPQVDEDEAAATDHRTREKPGDPTGGADETIAPPGPGVPPAGGGEGP